jgi:hypothetical protein
MDINRREFLASSMFALSMAGKCSQGVTVDAAGQAPPLRVSVDPERVVGVIPPDFTGLSFEMSSVATQGLLSASNHTYVQLVRALGAQGLIRIGGNVLDFSRYSSHGQADPAPKATVVNEAVVKDLGTFLDAIGWKLIWGVDLGEGTPENAAEEAQAVAASARDKLIAFEVGNEPDLFGGVHRPKGYDYAQFHSEYRRYHDAMRAKLPGAPFAGPDVAGHHTEWVTQFAADEGKDIKLLTHHYYAMGPPSSPASTIENLLKGNDVLTRKLAVCMAAARSINVPFRMCEANSCYGGGKPGVSDRFAAALWGLDFMFVLAAAGACGVNFETGVNHLGFLSSYSPLGDDGHGNYPPRPLYYAMLAFAQAGPGKLVNVQYDAGDLNVKAYAVLGDNRKFTVALINKEAARGVDVRLARVRALGRGSLLRLSAPSLESKGEETTLGDSAVTADGRWKAKHRQPLVTRGGEWVIPLPAASAALLTLKS